MEGGGGGGNVLVAGVLRQYQYNILMFDLLLLCDMQDIASSSPRAVLASHLIIANS